jgi:HAD superfamily hydrolase (TIGR01509 family)
MVSINEEAMSTSVKGPTSWISVCSSPSVCSALATLHHVRIQDEPHSIDGVLFDFHSTLVDQGSAQDWIDLARVRMDDEPVVTDDLVAFLDRIWENARVFDPDSRRDLSHVEHHRVFHELIEDGPGINRGFADALYETMLDPWHAYDDTVPTLQALRALGVKVAVLSNIGVRIDHVLDRSGIAALADARVLSYEVGHVKPDPEIFHAALAALDLPADRVLMVGDSPKDDVGAAVLGIRTLILPRTSGPVHGLMLVADLVAASQRG